MSISLALDALMIVLLGVTIAYAAVLNRRLAAWRNDKAELEKLIDRFNRAAQHADVGISTLKEASEETGRLLAQATAKGRALCDDLGFLIERAEPLADRLTERTRRSLRSGETASEPAKAHAPAPARDPEPYTIASDAPVQAPQTRPTAPVEQKAAPTASVPRPTVRPYRPPTSTAPRATAERNLLQALASLRKA